MTTDLLVDFLNTLDEVTGEDELATDSAAQAWFRQRGVAASGLRADEVRRVRDALRAAAAGRTPPVAALKLVPLHAVGAGSGLSLGSPHPLAPVVVTAVRLSFEGQWDRLKLCDADTCRYAYFDGSRNRSGKWCSMAVCGNRAKTRAFRERHRG